MRLIDAEALKIKTQKIKAEALEHGFAPESVCGDILLNFLDNAPTIEAKPIIYAHWKEWWPPQEFILTGEEKLYICSNCDAKYSDVENQRFCPWCGAQMDELVSNTDKFYSSVVFEENATTTNNTQKVSVDNEQ